MVSGFRSEEKIRKKKERVKMKKGLHKLMAVLLMSTMLIPGCKAKEQEEVKPIENPIEDEKPTDGFAYKEKEIGIVLTEYYGSSEEVDIPSEIDGKIVIGLDGALFANSEKLTRVSIPGTVESVGAGIFDGFPNVIVDCYEHIAGNVYQASACSLNILGENPECAQYVKIYSSETKSLMDYTFLKDGEKGEAGTYCEGASFAIENGTAVLTLNNFNGGMILAGNGSLTIRLAEGSVNNIVGADKAEYECCVVAKGSLIIEGNGSLSMKAGDRGGGNVISTHGSMTVQDRVKMFAKTGATDNWTCGISVEKGDFKVVNSHVEVQVAQTGLNSPAILVSPKSRVENNNIVYDNGKILLEQCEIVEGGNAEEYSFEMEGIEYFGGSSITEMGIRCEESLEGCSEYVRIEPKAE